MRTHKKNLARPQFMRTLCLVKKSPQRRRKPTNITLDPRVKAQGIALAESQATNLSQLANDLLIERLKAAKMWPPPSEKKGAA